MNYIETNDLQNGQPVRLYYEDWGVGQPVVLIHGWPLSHEMWEYQVSDLVNAGFRVIAYDRRGFGKSSKPWNGYDYDTLTDDLSSLLNELDLQDVTLVGFSMGGGEVVRYFSRYGGERVTKAVLLGSIVPYMLKTDDNPEGVDPSVFDEMITALQEDRIAFLDDFGKQFFGVTLLNKPASAPLLEYYRMLASVASPKATRDCVEAFAQTDFRDELQNVRVPTLIIHGDDDKIVPINATSKKAAARIGDNRYIIYEGAPHALCYTERKRLNVDLIEFIQEKIKIAAL